MKIEKFGKIKKMSILQNYVAPLAPIGLIIGYFLYQPQLRNTGIILSLCLSVVGCIAYALFQDVSIVSLNAISFIQFFISSPFVD